MDDLPDLVAALAALAALSRTARGAPTLCAIGWATVDAERRIADLGTVAFTPVGAEPSLGARAWVGRVGALDLVLLEPATEGRLAAALARRGEGLVALYVDGGDPAGDGMTALGRPGRLLPHGRPWGPFVIAVSPEERPIVPDARSPRGPRAPRRGRAGSAPPDPPDDPG